MLFVAGYIQVFADSWNGKGGYCVPVQGSALNNWKLKAFNGAARELPPPVPSEKTRG